MTEIGARLVLGAVFLMAAVSKFTDLPAFEYRLVLHSFLPVALAEAAAFCIPSLELTCAFCLVLNQAAREAALVTAFLLIAFLTLPEGDTPAACGCLLWPAHGDRIPPLPRNLVLLGASLWLALVPATRRKSDTAATLTNAAGPDSLT